MSIKRQNEDGFQAEDNKLLLSSHKQVIIQRKVLEPSILDNIERLYKILERWTKRAPRWRELEFVIYFFYAYPELTWINYSRELNSPNDSTALKERIANLREHLELSIQNFNDIEIKINFDEVSDRYFKNIIRRIKDLYDDSRFIPLTRKLIDSIDYAPRTILKQHAYNEEKFSDINHIRKLFKDALNFLDSLEALLAECLEGLDLNELFNKIKVTDINENLEIKKRLNSVKKLYKELDLLKHFRDYLTKLLENDPSAEVNDPDISILPISKILNWINLYIDIIEKFCFAFKIIVQGDNTNLKESNPDTYVYEALKFFNIEFLKIVITQLINELESYQNSIRAKSSQFNNRMIYCMTGSSDVIYLRVGLCACIYPVTNDILFQPVSEIFFVNFLNLKSGDHSLSKKERKDVYVCFFIKVIKEKIDNDSNIKTKWEEIMINKLGIKRTYYDKHKQDFYSANASTPNKKYREDMDQALKMYNELKEFFKK